MQQAPDPTFKPALMLMTGRALAFGATFFVPAVLARIFSQAEFGTYKQFILITTTLFGLGQLGLAECLFYFIPTNPERAGRYALNSVVMLCAMGALFSGILLWNSTGVAHWLNNEALADYTTIAAVYLTFMLMGTVLEIAMITRKHYRLATATYVVSDILRAALLVLPALVTRSLEWTFIGGAALCALRVAGVLRYLHTEFGEGVRFDTGLLRRQFAYALPFFSSVILYIAQQNYHQYAVAWHFDAAMFAIYAVGCLQIPVVDFMATPASNVMMVQMGENLRQGNAERILNIWRNTTRKLAFVFFPLTGLLLFNAYHLITLLYTKAYTASVPIFMVWCLAVVFSSFQTDGVLRTFAQNRLLIMINLIRLAAVVLLMNWFLLKFQLIGPVLLTISGILIAKAIAILRIKTLLRASLAQVLPWQMLGGVFVVSIISGVPAVLLNKSLDLPSVLLLPISGTAYLVSYAVLVLGFGLVNSDEKAGLKKLWAQIVPRQRLFRVKL